MQTKALQADGILHFQLPLCPALPRVKGCAEYAVMGAELVRIDSLLTTSEVEALFIRLSVEQLRAEAKQAGRELCDKIIVNHQAQSRIALRCEILRALCSGQAYRPMSLRLATSPRERQFCGIDELETSPR